MYVFDLMDPLRDEPRRPVINNLYDVFYNIMQVSFGINCSSCA